MFEFNWKTWWIALRELYLSFILWVMWQWLVHSSLIFTRHACTHTPHSLCESPPINYPCLALFTLHAGYFSPRQLTAWQASNKPFAVQLSVSFMKLQLYIGGKMIVVIILLWRKMQVIVKTSWTIFHEIAGTSGGVWDFVITFT